jgi:2-polyprenyl-3-methyl-5-hydroxy-6-metoxy-1,4-benzoquinol methylase
MTDDYLKLNSKYWQGRYDAANVESFIFRFYGRILMHDFGITGANGENVLDFGCGEGGALQFFARKGFIPYGVDIAANDIAVARQAMPRFAANFTVIEPKPNRDLKLLGGGKLADVVVSVQTLEFLSDSDGNEAIVCLYENAKPGAIIYATMAAWDMYYRNHATYVEDGLWHVQLDNGRVKYDLMSNFTKDKPSMAKKFGLFRPIYIDEYNIEVRGEGCERRFTYCGVKD